MTLYKGFFVMLKLKMYHWLTFLLVCNICPHVIFDIGLGLQFTEYILYMNSGNDVQKLILATFENGLEMTMGGG
jgi:hypothetical protein